MLLHHRYKILRDLAEGSFGKTLLAEDVQMPTRQRCVIKQLKPINDDRPEVVQLIQERFAREAAVLEAVGQGHSQIPDLLAYFQANEQFYLVQEWVEGTPLSELVQTPWPEDKVRSLLTSALDALAHVHAQNVIHRDLKPDNIILRQSDQLPCLIDFGAVKELMNTVVVPSESQASSVVIGTLGFMAPEQAVGRPVFSSDLYSLGMTAIYLLTARSPLEIPTDSMNGRLLWNQFAPEVSPRLAGILTRAIHPYTPTRFASATDMLAVLTEQPSQNATIANASSGGISSTHATPTVAPTQTASIPYAANTEVSLPGSSTASGTATNTPRTQKTQIGAPATQIGGPTTQVGSTKTELTANPQSVPSNNSHHIPQPSNSTNAGNKYYSLTPDKEQSKENGTFFVKVGGAIVSTLLFGVVSVFGYRALSSGFSGGGEIDASSPEKLERAISKLEKTVDSRPGNTAAQIQLIEGYVNRGRYEDALSQADALIQKGTDDDKTIAQALYWKGAVQTTQGNYAVAIDTLTQAVEKDDENALAFNLLGRAYQETGQYESALLQSELAADADPDYAGAYVSQAAIKELQGDFEIAETLLEQGGERLDNGEKISFYTFSGNFYANLATAKGEPEENTETAETYWKNVSDLSAKDAGEYAAKGLSQGLLGNTDDAMSSFEQALGINPNTTDAYLSRSIIHLGQGRIDAASADIESALTINPSSVTAYQLRSQLEVAREEPNIAAAIEAATQGLATNPNHPRLLGERCSGYYLSNEFDKAIADCSKSISVNPNFVDTYNVRGQAYFIQKNYQNAEADFTQVIDLNEENGKPHDAVVYSARALSRAELGDNAGAQADATEAIALDDDNPDYYKLRGMLRFINEEQDAAVTDLLKAEELYEEQGREDEDLNAILGLLSQLGLL